MTLSSERLVAYVIKIHSTFNWELLARQVPIIKISERKWLLTPLFTLFNVWYFVLWQKKGSTWFSTTATPTTYFPSFILALSSARLDGERTKSAAVYWREPPRVWHKIICYARSPKKSNYSHNFPGLLIIGSVQCKWRDTTGTTGDKNVKQVEKRCCAFYNPNSNVSHNKSGCCRLQNVVAEISE